MRRFWISISMAALMAIGVASGANANGPSRVEASGPQSAVTPAAAYTWSLTNVTCYTSGGTYGYGGMTGHAAMRENGVSGTTWMRMTAKYQRLSGGRWYTTKSRYTQNGHQFADNSRWHSLSWPLRFDGKFADATHLTRIYVLFEWYNNNTRIYWATRWSAGC